MTAVLYTKYLTLSTGFSTIGGRKQGKTAPGTLFQGFFHRKPLWKTLRAVRHCKTLCNRFGLSRAKAAFPMKEIHAFFFSNTLDISEKNGILENSSRKCWNRQTGTFEVRVSLTCGFKSHLPHQQKRDASASLFYWCRGERRPFSTWKGPALIKREEQKIRPPPVAEKGRIFWRCGRRNRASEQRDDCSGHRKSSSRSPFTQPLHGKVEQN